MTVKAVEEMRRFHTDEGTALTIGTFDGVHRGHQYVVEQVIAQAKVPRRHRAPSSSEITS